MQHGEYWLADLKNCPRYFADQVQAVRFLFTITDRSTAIGEGSTPLGTARRGLDTVSI